MKINRSVAALAVASTLVLSSFTPPAMAQGKGQTTLKIYNASNNSVTAYFTVIVPSQQQSNPGYLTSVLQVPFKPSVILTNVHKVQPVGVLQKDQAEQGEFKLSPGKMVSVTLPVGDAIFGTVSFGEAPRSCEKEEQRFSINAVPTSSSNGVNFAEFKLCNNTPNYGPSQRETVDINCAYGVNSMMTVDLYAAAGTGPWAASPAFPNVTKITGQPLGTEGNSPNVNKPGIFPPNCPECTQVHSYGCFPYWPPSSTNLCQLSRPSSGSGGNVLVTHKGFYASPQAP